MNSDDPIGGMLSGIDLADIPTDVNDLNDMFDKLDQSVNDFANGFEGSMEDMINGLADGIDTITDPE